MTATIHPSTIKFLKALAKNNNREWFTANKQAYLTAHENICDFADELIIEMNKHDTLETISGKRSLYRIYSDVRFKKDKSPYNPRFALSLQRATKLRRGGYYLNIKPGNNYVGCGFWGPNAADLNRIRQDIDSNFREWNKLLKLKSIQSTFGSITGEKVLTAPRGFNVQHPGIELLRHKQFVFRHHFTDEDVTSANFLKEVNKSFKAIRPFFDYMSEVLTTDLNGELIA